MPAKDETTIVTDVSRGLPKSENDDCLVLIRAHEPAAQGRRFLLQGSPVRIGRLAENEMHLDDDSVSRSHARIEERGGAWYLMDVGSVNGTLLNDSEISGHSRLHNGDRITIGKNIIKYLSGDDVETAYLEEIYQLNISDALTLVHNRRYFDEALEREVMRAKRYGRPLSLLMIDVDHFKAINDDCGHLGGDRVLHEVAQRLKGAAPDETVARYGGEEFAVILAETPIEEALVIAETLRRNIDEARMSLQTAELRVTVSIGCADVRASDTTAQELVARADAALYRAKHAGRNRVCA